MGFAEWRDQKYGRTGKKKEEKTFREAVTGIQTPAKSSTKAPQLPKPPQGKLPSPPTKQQQLRALNDSKNNLVSQRGALVRSVKIGQYPSLPEAEKAMGFGTLQDLNSRIKNLDSSYKAAKKEPVSTAAYQDRVSYLKDPSRKLTKDEQREAKEIASMYNADLRRKLLQPQRTKEDLQKMADIAALEAKYKGGTQFGLGLMTAFGGEALNKKAEKSLPDFVGESLPAAPNLYQSAQTQAPILKGAGLLTGEGLKYVTSAKALGAIPKVGQALKSGSMAKRIAAASAVDLPMDIASAALYSDGDKAEFKRQLALNVGLGAAAGTGIELIGKGIRSAKNAKAAKGLADGAQSNGAGKESFSEQIDAVMHGDRSPRSSIIIGETPRILQIFGANNHKLTLNSSDIRKIAYPDGYMGGKHNLGFFALKNLPQQLENPAAILKSATQKDSFVVFTEFLDNAGNPVMVPIHLNKNGRIGISNEIASMYGRKNFDSFIEQQRLAGNILYENGKEGLQSLPASGLQLSGVKERTDPIFNILEYQKNVNKNKDLTSPPSSRLQLTRAAGDTDPLSPNILRSAEHSNTNTTPRPSVGGEAGNTIGAAESGFDPYTKLLNENGAIAPGENPSRVYDVPTKNLQGQPISKAARTLAEAGVTDDAALRHFEKMLLDGAFVKETITDQSAMRNAVETIEQEGFQGSISAWNNAMKKRNINKDDIALGQMIYNQAVQNKDARLVQKMIADLILVSSESGRNLQATRMLKKLTPDGRLYGLEQSLAKVNRDLLDRYGKKHADIAIPEDLVAKLLKAEDSKQSDAVVSEIQQYIADRIPSTFADKWNAWRYLSMLGNPRTHIRNTIGNAVFFLAVKTKNLLAHGIESSTNLVAKKLLRKEGMNRTKSFNFNKSVRDFAKKDFLEMEDVIRSGGKHNPSNDINDKRKIFNTKWIEKARKGNAAALDAEDVFFMRPHYKQSLASYMNANKLTPEFLQSGTKEAYEALAKARDYAVLEAQKATFRDASALASLINQSKKNLARGNAGLKSAGFLLEGALPFTKTPINILKRGAEYSPIGVLDGLKKAVFDIKSGKATVAEAIDRIASGLTGSAVMALGAYLAYTGIASGGKEDDEGEETLNRMGGGQKYAIQIGNTSYTLDWLAPMALPFFAGVELFESQEEGEGKSFTDFVNAMSNIAEPMMELSFLQSVNNMIKAARYGENVVADVGTELLSSYAGQGVPTLFGQAARTIDPTRRSAFVDKNSQVPKFAQRFYQKQAAKIPGLSTTLAPFVNQWGEEQESAGGSVLGRAALNFLSPGYASEDKSGAVEDALEVLYHKTGDTAVLPAYADKYFKVEGETKHLNRDQYVRYAKERGQKSKRILEELVSIPQYNKLTDAEKAEAVKTTYQYSNAVAKSKVSAYIMDEQMQKIQRAEQKGISPALYLATYHKQLGIESDKDKDGNTIEGTSKIKKRDAIDNMTKNMPFEKREVLYDSFGVGLSDAQKKKWEVPAVRAAVGNKENYYKIQELISSMEADRDEYGNSISGTAKTKEISAISGELNVSYAKAVAIHNELLTFKHSISELSSNEQDDWKLLKNQMNEQDYLVYANEMRIVEGVKDRNGKTVKDSVKKNRFNRLLQMGMSTAQARHFLSIRYGYKW